MLRVELYGVHLGDLAGSDWRTFDFAVSAAAVESFGIGSELLSFALPLVPIAARAKAAVRRNFFAELLPEGDQLRYLALQAGVPAYDTIRLLADYGRDVAGALQIWDPDAPGEPVQPSLTPLDDGDIARLLNDGVGYPLGNAPRQGKTSLGGVQPKLVLALHDGVWNRVGGGAPSTHILKPKLDGEPTMIFDEEYGARFARALGLADYSTEVHDFAGVQALVVERYDRSEGPSPARIHQEDTAQALGVSREAKYQRQGGQATLRRIARLFLDRGDDVSARKLLQQVTLAVAVGNLDMHAKNVSILHPEAAPAAIAPAYDVVPQTHLDLDGELALAVNGGYAQAAVSMADLVAEGRGWGFADAEEVVAHALEVIARTAEAERPLPGAYPRLREDVLRTTASLLRGRAAGADTR